MANPLDKRLIQRMGCRGPYISWLPDIEDALSGRGERWDPRKFTALFSRWARLEEESAWWDDGGPDYDPYESLKEQHRGR